MVDIHSWLFCEQILPMNTFGGVSLTKILLMGWDNNTSKSPFMPNVYENEQEIRVTGFYGRFYLFPRSHCNSSVQPELSVMLSRAQNQNKKGILD